MNLTVHRGCFCAVFCDSAAAVRIHPPDEFSIVAKQKPQRTCIRRGFFGGRGWMSRAAHLKKPHRGFFPRRTIRRADAVRIHPPDEFSLVAKQKPQRTCIRRGFFGGRGWIRTTEAESSRFTVCPHWPLGNTPIFSFAVHGLPVYITTRMVVCQHLLRNFWIFVPKAKTQKQKPPRNQRS